MAKILIVDDSSLARKLIKRIVTADNHEIVEAESGEQALIQFRLTKPDVITMDVDMPGIGGLEASKRILSVSPDARIIIVSAHEQNDLRNEMSNCGVKFHVIKPVSTENLLPVLEKALLYCEPKTVEEQQPLAVNFPKSGENISVRHYSKLRPSSGEIIKYDEALNSIRLKIGKEFSIYGFFNDDPVVLGYEQDNQAVLLECSVQKVLPGENELTVSIDHVNSLDEGTLSKYPTSLSIDIKDAITKKKVTAVVKSISAHEMTIRAKSEYEAGEKIFFDLFMDSKVVPMNAEILNKEKTPYNFQYNIKPIYGDLNMSRVVKLYLENMMKEQKNALKDLKHGSMWE